MDIRAGRETAIGAVTLGILGLLLWTNAVDRDAVGEGAVGYPLEAVFHRTDGLRVGAQVRLAGLDVGQVVDQTLDASFRAHVTLRVDTAIAVPADSAAIIETDGLLGSKYIELQPGGSEDMLSPGQRIEYTQGSVLIEELLAKVIERAKARRADSSTESGGDGANPTSGPENGSGDGDSPFPSLFDPVPGASEPAGTPGANDGMMVR